MDKDNRTLGVGTTVYLHGDPPPLIMQLTLFSNKVCPDGLTDEEKAHWVIEEARKLGEEDFQRWKSLIFDKEKLDHPSEIFRQWALNEWNEVKAYETNQKSEWNRLNVESDALLSHLILEFKQDRLKDGNSIIDWSKPSTPFGWSKRFAPYFKANLCMQLLKSVFEGRASTTLQNPTIAFEALFTNPQVEEYALNLGAGLGLYEDAEKEKKNPSHNRYKSKIVALWVFLLHSSYSKDFINDIVTGQKACEAIARMFGVESLSKDIWSDNGSPTDLVDMKNKYPWVKYYHKIHPIMDRIIKKSEG